MMPMTPSGTRTRWILQAIRPLPLGRRGADRIGQRHDVLDASWPSPRTRSLIERQPVEQRAAQLRGSRRRHVARIGREDRARRRRGSPPAAADERGVLRVGAGQRQHGSGGNGIAPEPLHQLAELRARPARRSSISLPDAFAAAAALLVEEHEVVAMDHLIAPAKAEDALDVR